METIVNGARKPRVAVVSPFLDNAYGTERIIIRWISSLSDSFDIHIYSQRVQDLDLSKFTWHRIPQLPGPHLINFLWWYAANQLWRSWDARFRGLRHDIVFSPGPNCPDADVISVHIVFSEFARQTAPELTFARTPMRSWLRLLHRKIYYRLAIAVEGRAYRNTETFLVLIAKKTAADLERFYGRRERCLVLYLGLDHDVFNSSRRTAAREAARKQLAIPDEAFVLLLVGNDLKKKGIRALIDALERLRDLPVRLLIATREHPAPFQALAHAANLDDRIVFCPPRQDVDFFYAAADAYVGPSLEDTYALPPVEAMACGLPVIVSANNGTCEIITDGADGLILADPTDAVTLASMIRMLYEHPEFRARLGAKAAETARQFTWERNVSDLTAIFAEVLRRKERSAAPALAHESGSGGTAAQK